MSTEQTYDDILTMLDALIIAEGDFEQYERLQAVLIEMAMLKHRKSFSHHLQHIADHLALTH